MADDPELLRQFADTKSEEAFRSVVGRHINFVYATARRHTGSVERAEDVTQIVFTQLARRARVLARRREIVGWLYLTTRYTAANLVRGEMRRQKYEREAGAMHDLTSEAGAVIDWNKVGPVLDDALSDLGEKDRTAVLLRYFKEQSFSEVGAAIGVTEEAARKRVERGVDRIRRFFSGRGITATSLGLAALLENEAATTAPAGLAVHVAGAALSQAAVGAGLAAAMAHFLQFMSTTKLIVAGTVIVGVLAVGFSVRDSSLLRSVTTQYAAARKGYDASTAELHAIRNTILERRKKVADLRATLAAASGGTRARAGSKRALAAPTSKDAAAAGITAASTQKVNWALSRDPAVRANLRAWISDANNVILGPYFASMGWSQDKIAAVEDLLLEGDIHMGPATLTLRPESETLQQAEQSLKDFLGSEYPQFEEYQKSAFVRTVATGLAGNLAGTAAPLTPQQADQLTAVLAANSRSDPTLGYAFPGQVNWTAVLPGAQKVLSPPQYEMFESEVGLLASQPGLWSGINAILPGGIGSTPNPPPALLKSQGG